MWNVEVTEKRRDFLRRALGSMVLGGHSAWYLAGGEEALASNSISDPGQVLRRIRLTLVFSNPTDQSLRHQKFSCYLPVDLGAAQRLLNVQVSSAHSLHEGYQGHRILVLDFENVAPYAQKVISLTTTIERPSVPPIASSLADPEQWLVAERFIESDHEDIIALAGRLRAKNDGDSVRAIKNWVMANLRYAGYLSEERGALSALQTREGDCTEYADLVVALCRACSIPARTVGGYVASASIAPRPQDYHDWCEVFINGAWRVVDAQGDAVSLGAPHSDYVAYRIGRRADGLLGTAQRFRLDGALRVSFGA